MYVDGFDLTHIVLSSQIYVILSLVHRVLEPQEPSYFAKKKTRLTQSVNSLCEEDVLKKARPAKPSYFRYGKAIFVFKYIENA
jgi:hypothetical protein